LIDTHTYIYFLVILDKLLAKKVLRTSYRFICNLHEPYKEKIYAYYLESTPEGKPSSETLNNAKVKADDAAQDLKKDL
jgi:hypothetical protein